MRRTRTLADYTVLRLAVLEDVLERNRTVWRASRDHSIQHRIVARWLAQHESGEATLEALRSGEDVPEAMDLSHTGRTNISPLRPTPRLQVVINEIRGVLPTHGLSDDQMLHRACAYVLHEDAPLDHFVAWLRFFAERWGSDECAG